LIYDLICSIKGMPKQGVEEDFFEPKMAELTAATENCIISSFFMNCARHVTLREREMSRPTVV
jgi:hypothetical protein